MVRILVGLASLALLSGCVDSGSSGPPLPGEDPNVTLQLNSQAEVVDSVESVHQVVIFLSVENPSDVNLSDLKIEFGGSGAEGCGVIVPLVVNNILEPGSLIEAEWTFGEVAGQCPLTAVTTRGEGSTVVSNEVTIVGTIRPGQPESSLIPEGGEVVGSPTVTLSPVERQIVDRIGNTLSWEIVATDPVPIAVSTQQTPSGTAYLLSPNQLQGQTEIEVRTIYGVVDVFEVNVCQEAAQTVIRVFHATPQNPNPGCQ